MKKLLLLAISCQLSFSSFAQITITQADMPQAGDIIPLSSSTDTAGLPNPALTGAGITWDYSKLVATSQTVDTFLSPSSAPFAYQLFFNDAILYPAYKSTVAQASANLPALGPVTIKAVVNFYKDGASNYESIGYGANIDGLPTSVKDDTVDVVYNFPLKYGDSDSSHSSSSVKIPTLGFYMTYQYRINHVVGWGTLITPFGTFSALKVKTILYTSDSLYIDTIFHIGFKTPVTEQIQYKWLVNGEHLPVLQINENVIGKKPAFANAVYMDSTKKSSAGVDGISSIFSNISLYPNPVDIQANETATISYYIGLPSRVNVSVYSMDGRCLGNIFNGQQQAGSHKLLLSTHDLQLTPGVYLVKLDANGEQAVKKLVVF